MNQAKVACLCVLLLPLGACGPNPGPSPGDSVVQPVSETCTCEEFPFPAACKTQCDVGEAVVESVNMKERTAVITVHRGAETQQKTVPLSSFSAPVEKGATFTTLFKKETSAPGNPRIVRFTKK